MTWPVTLKLDSTAYPLSVVQRAAYSLADTVAIQVGIETNQISLTAHPAEARLTLSPEQAHSLILQHLNDFALRDHINRETAGYVAWQRAAREAIGNPALARLLEQLPTPVAAQQLSSEPPPLMMTRVKSRKGLLNFLSTFTTFGMPLDITVTSLRIEHLIPADPRTWSVMSEAYAAAGSAFSAATAFLGHPFDARPAQGARDCVDH